MILNISEHGQIAAKKDVKIRKAQAWRTCHQMRNIWKSTLSRKFKIMLMIATIESVLLYGSETWTLINSVLKSQTKGTYTRILRMVLNITYSSKIKNTQLYGKLESLSTKIRRNDKRWPLPKKRI